MELDEPEAKIGFAILSAGKSRRTDLNMRYAVSAMAVLELDKPASRYAWLKDRIGALTELGRIFERHGEQAAKVIADALMEQVNAGAIKTTRAAEYKIRELRRQALQA